MKTKISFAVAAIAFGTVAFGAQGCSSAPDEASGSSSSQFVRTTGGGREPPPPPVWHCPALPALNSPECAQNIVGYVVPRPDGQQCPVLYLADYGANWYPMAAPEADLVEPPLGPMVCMYPFEYVIGAFGTIANARPSSRNLCSVFQPTKMSYILPSAPATFVANGIVHSYGGFASTLDICVPDGARGCGSCVQQ